MRCIVFGSTGFIGGPLYDSLVRDGHDVLGVSRNGQDVKLDLVNCDFSEIDQTVKNFNPEVIFQFAADPIVKHHTHEISLSNIYMTHKILDACPKECKFVFASSATVFSPSNRRMGSGNSTNPKSVYGQTKLFCENLIKSYYKTYKKIDSYRILRFCAHVGPNATHGLLKDIVDKLNSDSPQLELLGKSPGSRKPFLYIDDSIRAIKCVTFDKNWDTEYVISPEDNLTVLEVANIVMDELHKHKPVKFLGQKANWPGDAGYVLLWNHFKHDKIIRTSEEAIRQYVRDIQ